MDGWPNNSIQRMERKAPEMRIGINARFALNPFRVGTPYYTYNLINYLSKIDRNNEYVLWLGGCFRVSVPSDMLPLRKKPNVEFRIKKWPAIMYKSGFYYLLQNYCPRFPFVELLVGKVDVFHLPYPDKFPPQMGGKKIVTIHDLSRLIVPQYYEKEVILKAPGKFQSIQQQADFVITDSLSTKNDIVERLKISEDRILVIPLGVNNKMFHPIDNSDVIHRVMRKYNIQSSYILYIGSLNPRKNLVRLIEAFHKILQQKDINCQLVLAGGKGWMYEEIFKKVDELRLKDKVIFTGYIPEEDIPALINGATAFAYVSLYEGFGLPPLEAMACGTPVIASNTTSIPEVVGDAGILVDPYNVDEIAQALQDVLENETLRAQMRKKGLERAKSFTWKKTARETLKAYEKVCHG